LIYDYTNNNLTDTKHFHQPASSLLRKCRVQLILKSLAEIIHNLAVKFPLASEFHGETQRNAIKINWRKHPAAAVQIKKKISFPWIRRG